MKKAIESAFGRNKDIDVPQLAFKGRDAKSREICPQAWSVYIEESEKDSDGPLWEIQNGCFRID